MRTFVNDDNFSNFTFKDLKRKSSGTSLGLSESIANRFKGNKRIRKSPKEIIELFRKKLIQLRELRQKQTLIRGQEAVNELNRQIDSLQKSVNDLNDEFVKLYADTQGAKNVINSVTQNPELPISDNYVAQNFMSAEANPVLVTPVETGVGYSEPQQNAPSEQQGSEVIDKTIGELPAKKDNTMLYIVAGVVAVLLLTRR